jgi:hypothetical protein
LPYYNAVGITATTINASNITSAYLNVLTSGSIAYLRTTGVTATTINTANITSAYLNVSTSVSIGTLNINPGFKGASVNANFVTYDVTGGASTHYFWEPIEVEGNIIQANANILSQSGTGTNALKSSTIPSITTTTINTTNITSTYLNVLNSGSISYLRTSGVTATTINTTNITSAYLNVLNSGSVSYLTTTGVSSSQINVPNVQINSIGITLTNGAIISQF